MSDHNGRGLSAVRSWWEKSKDMLRGRSSTTFLTPSAGRSDAVEANVRILPRSPEEERSRFSRRRHQLRQAQLNFRQRRANHVASLEHQVVHMRELIFLAEEEAAKLAAHNDAIRRQLQARPLVGTPAASTLTMYPGGHDAVAEVPVTLLSDDAANKHYFQVVDPDPSMSNSTDRHHFPGLRNAQPDAVTAPDLSPEHIQQAINFILALESPCWNHFHYSDFHPDASSPDDATMESGHTLMASSIALQTAPMSVFDGIRQRQEVRGPRLSRAGQAPAPDDVTWQASGLTLQTLLLLASSLSPPDLEVTPVQAFFELAWRFPAGLFLAQSVHDELRAELLGRVRCQRYGAAISRGDFDEAVDKILAPVAGLAVP